MAGGLGGAIRRPGFEATPQSKGGTPNDRFGLLGLLSVIQMTNPDLNTLALGTDLTTLGLNLNSTESLYSAFASPWADGPSRREPEFSLPMCYYMQPPTLKTGHIQKFQLETLFYIFYMLPKDTLQAVAASELYSRDWKFHRDLKMWFHKQPSMAGMGADGKSGYPRPNTYIYFDVNVWERRTYYDANKNLEQGFLSEEEVRLK
jgi:CCR4-NOT transcription complex subunit 2